MKIASFNKRILGTAITVLCLMGVHSPFYSPAQAQPAQPPLDRSAESGELPPNILPNSPLAQVIRLMQSGVDESIIMTYVTNCSSTFNLDSDKIIYLKDLGLPNEVVTAMMQRDQQLQQQMTATTYQPAVQPAPETTGPPETAPMEQPAEVTVNYFYDTLTPYGTWVDVDGYGRCWRPSVEVYNPGWQPYCDHGHWVYTDCGWYWFSDYSWGWAPFHYGRWFRDARWGWCWTPDTVWGPSWVTWRYSDSYCGWAPLPPFAVYREGVGFFYRGVAVGVGFDFGLGWNHFTFVPIGHFCDPHPRRYCVASGQVTQIYNHTTVINNFNVRDHSFVNHGIDPERITAVTRTPIHPISIRDAAPQSGHGPHGAQLGNDGHTLVVNRPHFVDHPVPGDTRASHPVTPASPVQNHSTQPNNNWPASPTRPAGQPQERNNPSAPSQNHAQHASPPASYNSSLPAVTAPNYNNRTYSPRSQEQQPTRTSSNNTRESEAPVIIPAASHEQTSAPEASRRYEPSSASASQKSDKADRDQSSSGNGPRH